MPDDPIEPPVAPVILDEPAPAPPAETTEEPPLAAEPVELTPAPEDIGSPPVIVDAPVGAPPMPAVGFVPEPVTVTYTRRQRTTRIIADNTIADAPVVIFEREIVIDGDDGSRRSEPMPPLRIAFRPDRLIYMRDLSNLQPTGDVHPWAVPFACLYSAAIDEGLRAIDDPSMADKPPFAP